MTALQDFNMAPQGPEDDEPPLDLPFGDELLASLDQIDISTSLLDQYQAAIRLRRQVLSDDEIPANQRAQVLNAVSSILAQLVKLRTDLFNSERQKRTEGILLSVLRHLPEEARNEFMEVYERELLRT